MITLSILLASRCAPGYVLAKTKITGTSQDATSCRGSDLRLDITASVPQSPLLEGSVTCQVEPGSRPGRRRPPGLMNPAMAMRPECRDDRTSNHLDPSPSVNRSG